MPRLLVSVPALLCLALAVPSSLAMESKLVAVLPISAPSSFDPTDLTTLDETIRGEAAKVLTRAGYIVLTNDVQLRVLEENGLSAEEIMAACEQSCPLAIAKDLKARLFVTSQVVRASDGTVILFVRLYNGATGALLSGTSPIEGADLRSVRRAFSSEAERFFTGAVVLAGSELQFGSVDVRVPTVKVDASGGMRQINIHAEKLLDAAVEAEKDEKGAPETKARAWCELAEYEDRNPYQDSAQRACVSWTEYTTQLRRAEAGMTEDYRTLSEYLQLKHKGREQRLAALDAFLAAYQKLDTYPMVKAVGQTREAMTRGEVRPLPAYFSAADSDGDGFEDRADRCPFERAKWDSRDGCGENLGDRTGAAAGAVWDGLGWFFGGIGGLFVGAAQGVGAAITYQGWRWFHLEDRSGWVLEASVQPSLVSPTGWYGAYGFHMKGKLPFGFSFGSGAGQRPGDGAPSGAFNVYPFLHLLALWPDAEVSLLDLGVGLRGTLYMSPGADESLQGSIGAVVFNEIKLARRTALRLQYEHPLDLGGNAGAGGGLPWAASVRLIFTK